MLINPPACPICGNEVNQNSVRCPSCRCTVQFTPDPPTFSRGEIVESLVQPIIDRHRAQLATNQHDGIAHYILGLCYLNYALRDQGIAELQRAADLLPEKHAILFELAVLLGTSGTYARAVEQLAIALQMAPERRDYQFLHHYLHGAAAQAGHQVRTAVTSWTAAYQLAPEYGPAVRALTEFIAAHQAKLTQPIARAVKSLESADLEGLRILNSDPAVQQTKLPQAPRKPGDPGKISMSLLRKLAPARAVAIEHMHSERVMAFEAAVQTYTVQHEAATAQRESTVQQWQAQTQAIRTNLPMMARLCLAVYEEEERRRQEEARRQAEAEQRRREAELRRQEAQQRAQAQAAQKSTAAVHSASKPVREKQYLSTKARYIQGLPKGRENDGVTLTVTNLRITVRSNALIGSWEVEIPVASLSEVTTETVKHLLSSEKRMRLSYRDDRGMLAHAIFTDLKVDEGVKKILQARSGA